MKLVVGCGFLGLRVARRWLAEGASVAAVTRDPARAAALAADGLRPIVADVLQPATLAGLPPADTVLYAVGWTPASGASRRALYVDGLHAVLSALAAQTAPPQRIILISSTGVYGQAEGERVDEDSPCAPRREAGQALRAAEQLLAVHPLGRGGIVLRMAGMYGPGRFTRSEEILSGAPLVIPAGRRMNLIHVDDAARAVLAAERQAQPPRTFLIADGHPVERREFFCEVARLLGAPPPRFVDPPADGLAHSHAASDKRADNRRMLAELGFRLRYPSYREGLAAMIGRRA